MNELVGSLVHMSRMIRIASSRRFNLSWYDGKVLLIPYARDSCSFQPAPIPMNNLPLLSTSSVAPIFANTDGCRYMTPVTSVPNFIFVVKPASTDIVVQPSNNGSCEDPII